LGIKGHVAVKSEFPRFEAAISGEGYGFVYVMSYPDSSKVKIGHALHPDTRASNIGGTLAPEDPQLEAYYWCSENREKVERAAHSALAQHRGKGEWFSVSVPQAMQAIELAAVSLEIELKLIFSQKERTGIEKDYVWVPSKMAYVRRTKSR
jgi:hypothetical protein